MAYFRLHRLAGGENCSPTVLGRPLLSSVFSRRPRSLKTPCWFHLPYSRNSPVRLGLSTSAPPHGDPLDRSRQPDKRRKKGHVSSRSRAGSFMLCGGVTLHARLDT